LRWYKLCITSTFWCTYNCCKLRWYKLCITSTFWCTYNCCKLRWHKLCITSTFWCTYNCCKLRWYKLCITSTLWCTWCNINTISSFVHSAGLYYIAFTLIHQTIRRCQFYVQPCLGVTYVDWWAFGRCHNCVRHM